MEKETENELIKIFKEINNKVGWILFIVIVTVILSILGGLISFMDALLVI